MFLDADVAKEGPFTYTQNFPITDIFACARSVEKTAKETHMLRFLL